MPEPISKFFAFFKTRPIVMLCYGLACFGLGLLF